MKRIEEIDVAKGIAIILVVIGHSGIPITIRNFIYMFHMPFFFFVSGLTSNYNTEVRPFILKRFSMYVIPFLVYVSINVVLRSVYDNVSIFEYVKDHLYIGRDYPLWFVPILTLSQLMAYFISRISKTVGDKCVYYAIIVLLAFSQFISLNKINMPWSLSVLPFACSFVLLGHICGIAQATKLLNINKTMKLCITIFICIFIFFVSKFYTLECYNNISTEPVSILFVTGVLGSYMLIFASSIIKWTKKVFIYIGKNTFIIMALSSTIYMYENRFMDTTSVYKYILLFIILAFLIFIKNLTPFFKTLHL